MSVTATIHDVLPAIATASFIVPRRRILAELNAAIRALLDELNSVRCAAGARAGGRSSSNSTNRARIAAAASLRIRRTEALPGWPRYHIEIAKHYYSVPHPLIRQEV
jgi:hypothetical protein